MGMTADKPKRRFRLWMLLPLLIGLLMVAREISERSDVRYGLRPSQRAELYYELQTRENAAIQANMALTSDQPNEVFLARNKASKDAIRGDIARRFRVTLDAVDAIRQEGIAKGVQSAEARRSPQ